MEENIPTIPALQNKELDANAIPFANDGFSTPVIYADYIRGALIASGVVKLRLIENRVNAITDELQTVAVATLILPQQQLKAWGEFFLRTAEGLSKDG